MRFGVVSYERKFLKLNGNENQNMGDWGQTIAMEQLYHEWGITDYIHVSRNDVKYYDGEYVILPYNGFNTLINRANYKTETFPLSHKIIPVFFSMHYHDRYIPLEMKEQLKAFEPIGCRDEETMVNMRKHGIRSYLSGCVTSLLPRREEDKEKQNKILIIDAPKDIDKYIPSELIGEIEYHTNLFHITRTEGPNYMTSNESKESYEQAKKLLNYCRDNAKLIITSRLHIASPCMAMGIPVILVKEDFDGRFAWIEKYLPLYSKERWNEINWYPKPVEYEKEKLWIKGILKKKIDEAYDEYNEIYSLSEYFEEREDRVLFYL